MANDPEESSITLAEEEEEEGGGPVKPFLEHLEDLRWTLIKCIAVVLVAMVVCLISSKYIVQILEYPIYEAARIQLGTNRLVSVRLGDRWQTFKHPETPVWQQLTGVKKESFVGLEAVQVGTNFVLSLSPLTNPPPMKGQAGLVTLKNYSLISPFSIMIKIAIYGGLGLASPFLFFFIGQFVMPALKIREREFMLKGVAFGSLLFIGGLAFCYFIIMKVTVMAAVQLSEYLNFEANEWRAEDYIGFFFKFMIAMGLSFQLPVVLLTMVKIGLLNYKKLVNFRMYWVVVNLVISAFITPTGDPITMILMALPLQVLYEISIFIAWLWYRRDQRKLAKA